LHLVKLFIKVIHRLSTGYPQALGTGVAMRRFKVSKSNSARQFRAKASRTKAPNMKAAPMRGGIRL